MLGLPTSVKFVAIILERAEKRVTIIYTKHLGKMTQE